MKNTLLTACAVSTVSLSSLQANPITIEYLTTYLANTAAMKDRDARLTSYDKLAQHITAQEKEKTSSTEKTVEESTGVWSVVEEVSPIDDSKTVRISVAAEDQGHAILCLRRKEGELDTFIITDEFLGINDLKVTTRVDKKTPVTRSWNMASNNRGVFHPNPALLLKVLKKHEKLIVRLTPYGESTQTYTFKLSGLDGIADKLK